MKKDRFTILLAAAAMLAACSSNDTFKEVDTQDVVIGFNGQYVEKHTKAEITSTWLTTANSDFGVWGYRYAIGNTDPVPFTLFSNERVYYVTSPADWKHTTVRYWDKGASDEYYFYAYAPYSATSASFNRAANGGLTYTMPVDGNSKTQVFVDTDNALDLCIAAKEQTDYAECLNEDAHVHFTFSHALSKLSFKVKKEGFGNSDVVRLTSITFAAPISTTAIWSQNALTGVESANVAYTDYAAPANETTNVKTAFTDSGADTPDDPSTTETNEYEVVGVADVKAEETADNIIAGSKSFIVIPNENPANPSSPLDDEKHLIKLTVGYELTYGDNGQKESHTAYGDVRILYQSGNHYIVTINIKPVAIEFHVDAITDFTTVNTASFDVQ